MSEIFSNFAALNGLYYKTTHSMTDFNIAAENIKVHFTCLKCKHYVEYKSTSLPVPDYSADREAESERALEDAVVCDNCGAQYDVDIRCSMSNGFVAVFDDDFHSVEDVVVDEVYGGLDEDDMGSQLDTVAIQGFWREFDMSLTFNPHVTIITGGNGSGKTTLLRLLQSSLCDSHLDKAFVRKIISMQLGLTNGAYVKHSRVMLKTQDNVLINIPRMVTSFEMNGEILSGEDIRKIVSCEMISSFDNPIDAGKYSQLLQSSGVVSELDLLLERVESDYSGYWGELGVRMEQLGFAGNDNASNEAWQAIVAPRNKFHDIIDDFFAETGKKISRKDSKFIFNKEGRPSMSWKDLSSGEKQVLYIFAKVLLQRNAPVVLLMDEPEISMHVDWQEKLIENILELNPYCQLVIATHSPSVISLKWREFVVNMEDLKVQK